MSTQASGHFPLFFEYWIRQERKFIQKKLEKPNSKTYFPVGTRSKTLFLASTTAVDTQQMSKMQSRLVVKPKVIESISLTNQMICAPNFRVPFDVKVLPIFDRANPVIIKLTLAFLNLYQNAKKISSFYQFTLLRYSRYESSII